MTETPRTHAYCGGSKKETTMRHIKLIGSVTFFAVIIIACSNPNPSCSSKPGLCTELSISGTGTTIDVGQERVFQMYASLYNDGEPLQTGMRVTPREVTFRIGNPDVIRVETRVDDFGAKRPFVIGLTRGRSTLGAHMNNEPTARAEVILDVK